MKAIRLRHLAVALTITALLSYALGSALRDAVPAVFFICVLALGVVSAIVFRALAQRRALSGDSRRQEVG